MLRKTLTEEGVAKLKTPATGQIDIFDVLVPGLILRVGYGGSKTWLARFYIHRRNAAGRKVAVPTTHKLGRHPILKVKEARDKARVFLADPLKAKAQADTGSFKEVAENFVKRYVVEKQKLRSKDEIVRLLNTLIYPYWRDRQFRDIKRSDVADLLDHLQDHHGARQADKALAIIRKMMNWHTTRDGDYVSVIVKGMGRYNATEQQRERTLSDDEIRALWMASGTFGALLKVALLTAQRKDKVATMQWDDIVRNEIWIISTALREKPNAGTLRLPPAVLDIINAQPRIAGNRYVFAGRGTGPFNAFSQEKKNLDKKLGIPPWVIHDLRRTAKTLMARAGVRPDISERVLGHTIKGVEGVYDQYDYSDEKADALAALAALVDRIINPPTANVVTFPHTGTS
jgi:integrase